MNSEEEGGYESNTVNKQTVLLITTLSSFLTPFMGSSLTIALPSIGREFSLSAILLSWIATSYILVAAMFLLPFGKMADIYGRKKIFVYGIWIYTISSFLCGISHSAMALFSFRIIQGIGGAMIFGTGVAILTSVYPAGERGKAMGINTASVYLGLSLGPVLGGFLTQDLGWRSIFFANIPFGLIIYALVLWKLKGEWAEAKGETFDLGGSVIYSFSLVAIMYGFTLLPSLSGMLAILLGMAGIFLFVRWEKALQHPLLNMNLFRNNTVFVFSNLAALINYSATSAVGFLLSLYLQFVKGLSPQEAGLVMVFQPVVQTIFSPSAGRLSDRMEPRLVASMGMALTVAGLLFLVFLNEETTMTYIIASLVLLGGGFGLFSSPNTNAVMSSVEKKLYGVASSALATMRLLGQMLSMGIAILIFALYKFGNVQITPSSFILFLASARVTFILFVILCCGGIFASLARGNVH